MGEEIRVEVWEVVYISDCRKFPEMGSHHFQHHIKDYGINRSLKSKSHTGIYMASIMSVYHGASPFTRSLVT